MVVYLNWEFTVSPYWACVCFPFYWGFSCIFSGWCFLLVSVVCAAPGFSLYCVLPPLLSSLVVRGVLACVFLLAHGFSPFLFFFFFFHSCVCCVLLSWGLFWLLWWLSCVIYLFPACLVADYCRSFACDFFFSFWVFFGLFFSLGFGVVFRFGAFFVFAFLRPSSGCFLCVCV